jgi:hypothetical protein
MELVIWLLFGVVYGFVANIEGRNVFGWVVVCDFRTSRLTVSTQVR